MIGMNALDSKNYDTLEIYYATKAKLNYDLFAKRNKDESMLYIIAKTILGEDYLVSHTINDWIKAFDMKCIHERYKDAHDRVKLEEKELDEILRHKVIDEVKIK